MIVAEPEKRATGPLIAFIDLLFLLVAFFILLLFFLHRQQTATQSELEQTQQNLETVQAQKSTVERVLEEVEPYMGKITALQKAETERRRAEDARVSRKREKETIRLEYELLPAGLVRYQERELPMPRFVADVVTPLRAKNWIAFRVLARPETPFGIVVDSRRAVLDEKQEFDTYWDNLAANRATQ